MISIAVILLLQVYSAQCMVSSGRAGHGFVGYGISMYDPNCAYSCRSAISSSALNCSTYADGAEVADMAGMSGMGAASTSGGCYATDDTFLQTLAYCISTRCDGKVAVYRLEKWWLRNVAGTKEVQPDPKYSYQQALARVTEPPTTTLVSGDPLNKTSLVKDADYIAVFNAQEIFEAQEVLYEKYGQAILIPKIYTANGKHDELLTYVSNRIGVLSFANLPLIFLYAGRNNVLLWLTNWSHSTFILLHRWIAYISTLQACIHSAVWLQNYVATGSHTTESKLQYWFWGIIATLSMSILLPSSIIPIRQKAYEVFLLWHISLSVLVIAGCYLHIYYRFENQWGYELWILITIAIWGFDRVMRILRVARNGICTAQITTIDEDYIRIDIKGVASGVGHAYLYFPTLTWRVWENHPFSVASTLLPALEDSASLKKASESDLESDRARTSDKASPSDQDIDIKEISSGSSNKSNHLRLPPSLALSFFVRARSGLTTQFPANGSIPVLVESIYGTNEDLSGYPSLICIAGGVGVTAIMPYLQSHPGSKKLYWGVRNAGIVKTLESSFHGIDKEVFVGTKMVIKDVLEDALANASPDGAAVVVSGPSCMADEVRVLVSQIGARGGRSNIKLVEESFTW
ncbi:uncharacterized protein BP5553_07138 [Venustampulla echinocandica]|uniref:Ferric oxidoreductase domain-containing protein n=1 Tax=Venustampulla echinocandica TaxID=2656787 RepID=A0A370TIM8_9HELO|nr:uncharacterized protein BP5553_07138 [Venustampulla echinocandica]RDL35207.1 hypothetical protein BP5553_07138 [Venustampulla echinocandica]